MIQLTINGEQHSAPAALPLQQLLDSLPALPDSFAIAVNENFVPRSAYDSTTINEGDQVELLVPMQGG